MTYMTVDEMIEVLEEFSGNGYGSHVVTVNDNTYVARSGETPQVKGRQVDFEGHTS